MRKLSTQNRLLSMNNSPYSSSTIDSNSWVIHIRSFFDEQELEEDDDQANADDNTSSVCVYNVPRSLRALKPEAYSPQFIALGPYHHWRHDLYEMERYKLICAKKVQKDFKSNLKFEDLVKKLLKKEYEIRGCYSKYLDMDGEALAWMMAIDGLFLLEFLNIYANNNNSSHNNNDDDDDGSLRTSSVARMSYLVNAMGKKLAYDAILKDTLMLENQIPIFVLKKILRIQCSSTELAHNLLHPMMMGVCRELSPLILNEEFPISDVLRCAHLLDLLYHLIVPKQEQDEEEVEIDKEVMFRSNNRGQEDQPALGDENNQVLSNTWQLASKLTIMKKLSKFLDLKPIKLLAQLPIKVISKLPIVSAMAPALETMLGVGGDNTKEGSKLEKSNKDGQAPLVEQIMVPSVESLSNSGVQFCPSNGDISSISFDCITRRFYLPVVHLDGNTEVMMRNLVAYEASSVSGPLVLARYTELMNGIIDTAKDARILRASKVIISRLKTDAEVSEMWNGMTKAIRLTKVAYIDKAIEEVNRYHENTLKIKCHRLMKVYVYGSWRFLIILATILLLGLMALQSFCTVYSCPRLFNIGDNVATTPPHK